MSGKPLRGELALPGDKSISHRAFILASLAEGKSRILGLSDGQDVRSTRRCLEALGVRIRDGEGIVEVSGAGLRGLKAPREALDCGNSGTTMRLLAGVLAGQDLSAKLTGDDSLRRRPMERVAKSLRRMGAGIETSDGGTAPITVRGGALKGVDCVIDVASAQVKSAVLLAGLTASGRTSVTEPSLSRDHTERMLPLFGVRPRRDGLTVTVDGGARLSAADVAVPGDPSSAAFWAVAATIVPGSRVVLRNVCVNPTRTGFLDVLRRMGARIGIKESGTAGPDCESVADLTVEHAALSAVDVSASEAPRLIDEVPILALAASQARGESRLRGLSELRHKESDRLSGVAALLNALGARAKVEGDDLLVTGPAKLSGGMVKAVADHRMAMTALIAGLASDGPVRVDDEACAAVSYPGFARDLARLRG